MGTMENPDYVYGMGVAKSSGNKLNSILHTDVLQIKAFWLSIFITSFVQTDCLSTMLKIKTTTTTSEVTTSKQQVICRFWNISDTG